MVPPQQAASAIAEDPGHVTPSFRDHRLAVFFQGGDCYLRQIYPPAATRGLRFEEVQFAVDLDQGASVTVNKSPDLRAVVS
jgi:hypothetical protein